MLQVLHSVIPEFDTLPKSLLLTHADVDHCGIMSDFYEVITSHNSARSLTNEVCGENGFREQAEYNQYASILMTSVDTDPKLCAEQRKGILRRLGARDYSVKQ